jgi:hypothetical protein
MGGGSSKPKNELPPSAAEPAVSPRAQAPQKPPDAQVIEFSRKPSIISPPPTYKPPFRPAQALAPISAAPPALKQVKGSGAFSVESLLKQAHEGIDLGRRASLLFDSFDADKNGIMDNDELANLIVAMLQTTLNTIKEANRDAVKKSCQSTTAR